MDISLIFIELGLAVIALALLARLASRWGFSAIPLYLLAGLSFGNGGLLLLYMLRLELQEQNSRKAFDADCLQVLLVFY